MEKELEKELEKEKIKRAILAIEDLLQSGIYDYYHGIDGSDEMVKTKNYFWVKYDLIDLKDKLTNYA